MILKEKYAEWLVVVFITVLIAVVFQQISTSLTEQGIASGSPYDNGAAFPWAVAILMGLLLVASQFIRSFTSDARPTLKLSDLKRPAILLILFAFYLVGLGTLGYHLSTTPMIIAMLLLCGYYRPVGIIAFSLSVSFGLAFFFEIFLKIVLPGGWWGLNIPW